MYNRSSYTLDNSVCICCIKQTQVLLCIYAGPSLPPQNVRSYVLSPRSVSISWLPPSVVGQNGIVLYYILLLFDEQLLTGERTINTTLTSHSFSDLEEYNIYNYSIAAATRVGVGVFSPTIQFTTHEDSTYFCFFVVTKTNCNCMCPI